MALLYPQALWLLIALPAIWLLGFAARGHHAPRRLLASVVLRSFTLTLLILAIAVFHLYSCILVDHIEKNGLMSSIVSGYKYPTREEILEARDGGPELLEQLEPAEAQGSVGVPA